MRTIFSRKLSSAISWEEDKAKPFSLCTLFIWSCSLWQEQRGWETCWKKLLSSCLAVPAKTLNSHGANSFCPNVGNNYHCESPTETAPMLVGQRGAGTGQQGIGEEKIQGKRETHFARQQQFGISKLNTNGASVRMLHCNTVALNPLLSL